MALLLYVHELHRTNQLTGHVGEYIVSGFVNLSGFTNRFGHFTS